MPPEDRHSGLPGGNGSGADVKSGIALNVDDGTIKTVTFGTPFASVPRIVLTIASATIDADDRAILRTVSADDFSFRLHKGHGGSGHTWAVHWIATDAGDP